MQERYLRLLKDSLLNELYLENEVRLLYIFAMLGTQRTVDPEVVRDIGKKLPNWVEMVQGARQEGKTWWNMTMTSAAGEQQELDLRNICEFSHTMIGRKRLDNIEACLDQVRADNVPGDVAETGVWRGGATIFMRGYLEAWEMGDRLVWVADSFEGLPVPTRTEDAGYDFSASKVPILSISLEEVRENFRRYDLLDDQVRFLEGWFSDTLASSAIERLALLRLDGDLYESTMDALTALYDRVSPGGFVIVDDYGDFEPCKRAVDEFREARSIRDPIQTIDWTGVFWRKSA